MTEDVIGTLRTMLRGDTTAALPDLVPVLGDQEHGLSHQESCRLTYARLDRLAKLLPPGSDLLGSPPLLFAVAERTAVASPSLFMASTIHFGLALAALTDFATGREDLADYVEELETTRSYGSFLVTELGRGTSHLALRTVAEFDPDTREFVLTTPDPTARKFMANTGLTGVAKLGIVCARLRVAGRDRGVFPFVIRLTDEHGPAPGVRIQALPPTGAAPLDYAVTSFDHVRLEYRNWLRDTAYIDDEGVFHDPLTDPDQRLLRSVSASRNMWALAPVALAATARAGVAVALRHAFRRPTMGRLAPGLPVIGYRNQQHALLGALATAYATTCLANRNTDSWLAERAAGPDPATERAEVTWAPMAAANHLGALTKAVATWAAEQVAADCRLSCGALGVLSVNRFLDYQGLAQVLNAAGGDNQLIVLDVARAMVARRHYQPPGEGTDSARPWSPLLGARERWLLDRLAAAVHRGDQEFTVWNDQLALAAATVRAYGRRLTLEAFAATVEALPLGPARAAAGALCELFALREVLPDLDWYVRTGLLDEKDADRLPDRLNDLCDRVRPLALTLVEAMGVPHDLVGAPIAADDYVAVLSRPQPSH